ncbi:MAG TPA: hypothetical protein VGN08_09395 [Solirubrobacteraceae bacterium]
MPRAHAAVVLVLCTLAWLVPAGARAAAPPAVPALLGGVNIDGLSFSSTTGQADAEIAAARQMHVKIVRADIPWSVLEPNGPGSVDPRALAFTDRLVGDAAAAGIRVVATVASSPCWASAAPPALARKCSRSREGDANSWPPAVPADYAAFVAYLAGRYGGKLAAIEIWNEPDQSNEAYFAGPHKAERYAAMLRSAYPAIKQASPGLTVVAGSLVGSNGVFLRDLYRAGIKGFYDGLSVHYYNLTLASLRSIHEVQLANGDSTRLWLDEFGWTSCWPRHRIEEEQACVTAQIQAANLTTTFRAMAHTPYIAAALVYKLRDSPSEEFGMLSTHNGHKPAFLALAGVMASLGADVPRVRLTLRHAGRRVIASGSGPVGDFMGIEAFQGSVLRWKAVFILDRFNHFSIALPPVLGTRGLRVRVFQYSTGLGRGAQQSI